MRIVFILVFFCLMSLETVAQNVAKTLSSIALDGRWNVTFDLPGQQYQTIIEFSAANDGRVNATVLDSTSLKFNDGRLAENKLLLKVTLRLPFLSQTTFWLILSLLSIKVFSILR